MTLSKYLTVMIISTLLCWGAWLLVVWQINPFEANFISFLIFYMSLFLALIGTLAIVGFLLRIIFYKKREPYFRQVKKSFRHSIFLTILLVAALILQSQRFLNWWNLIILMLAVIFFELFFLTGKTSVNK